MQETNKEVKLCKDCKYFLQRYNAQPDCMRQVIRIDPVYGNKAFNTCSEERQYFAKCGRDAVHFETKASPSEIISTSMIASVIKFFKGDKE